jgi:hypothetical protein
MSGMKNILRLILLLAAITLQGPISTSTAASIEKLVMPGPVAEGHAELEESCRDCHAFFSKELQRGNCLACHDHKNIADDIDNRQGFHGTFTPARVAECSNCHADHLGRAADIVGLNEQTFNHEFTDFTLEGTHQTLTCISCHDEDERHREAESQCIGCHKDDDIHKGGLDEECKTCHQPTIWPEADFDHKEKTEYALTGAHEELNCNLCHINERYEETATDCYSCHRIDDVHSGQNGTECETCHVTRSWDESTFDHASETEFSLLGRHGKIACAACHTGGKFEEPLEKECIACHRQDDQHLGKNGEECGGCHEPISWIEVDYDHAEETEFPLLGAHAEIVCSACHKGPVYDVKLEQDCYSCHSADDVHSGEQGEQCNDCHGEQSWTASVKFDHDITKFPLIGLHAVVSCEACHLTEEFQKAPGKCRDCHSDESSHRGRLGSNCNECHNPNGWQIWQFDHDTQTSFMLDGEHTGLDCTACHTSPVKSKIRLSKQCGVCHRVDDIHNGQFGLNCERCHTTDSFFNVGSIR